MFKFNLKKTICHLGILEKFFVDFENDAYDIKLTATNAIGDTGTKIVSSKDFYEFEKKRNNKIISYFRVYLSHIETEQISNWWIM